MSTDKLQDIGRGAYDVIASLVDAFNRCVPWGGYKDPAQAILEDPLEVCIEWRGEDGDTEMYDAGKDLAPVCTRTGRYMILLSTGGPATRIIGELDDCQQPRTATLEAQDWFKPWTVYEGSDETILLDYARQFYYGE